MNKTPIEYLTHSWNPITMRCSSCSPGCANCWHIKRADMLARNPKIHPWNRAHYAGIQDQSGEIVSFKDMDAPMCRKKPARIGVQFMGDLWHKHVGWENIDDVFFQCHKAEHHTYIFLTKRIEVAFYYFNSPIYNMPEMRRTEFLKHKNIWFLVTICNQEEADKKIPILLQIPAKIRGVSFEPLLSRIKAAQYALKLDWAIIGCESGAGRRHTDLEWIEGLKDAFVIYNKPVFIKQAEINEKIVKMPKIDGKIWGQYPG